MKIIIDDMKLVDFNAWGGAQETKKNILEAGKSEEFESYIDEIYPDGLTDTQLNDILWFDDDSIYEYLGIDPYGELGDDEEEDDNEYTNESKKIKIKKSELTEMVQNVVKNILTEENDLPHYFVLGNLFVDYDDAVNFCDKNNLSYNIIEKSYNYNEYPEIPMGIKYMTKGGKYYNLLRDMGCKAAYSGDGFIYWKENNLKESQNDNNYTPKRYIVKVQHDKGKINIKTSATSEDKAKEIVMKHEKCPESAILSVTELNENKKPIKEISHALAHNAGNKAWKVFNNEDEKDFNKFTQSENFSTYISPELKPYFDKLGVKSIRNEFGDTTLLFDGFRVIISEDEYEVLPKNATNNFDKNKARLLVSTIRIIQDELKKADEMTEETKKPSSGLTKKQKSDVVKKAKSGKDIGKTGKAFDKIADKASKEYGSKEAGERVAASAMWKNIKRESVGENKINKKIIKENYNFQLPVDVKYGSPGYEWDATITNIIDKGDYVILNIQDNDDGGDRDVKLKKILFNKLMTSGAIDFTLKSTGGYVHLEIPEIYDEDKYYEEEDGELDNPSQNSNDPQHKFTGSGYPYNE